MSTLRLKGLYGDPLSAARAIIIRPQVRGGGGGGKFIHILVDTVGGACWVAAGREGPGDGGRQAHREVVGRVATQPSAVLCCVRRDGCTGALGPRRDERWGAPREGVQEEGLGFLCACSVEKEKLFLGVGWMPKLGKAAVRERLRCDTESRISPMHPFPSGARICRFYSFSSVRVLSC